MALDNQETVNIIRISFEAIFYGIYCAVFGLYFRIQLKRRDGFNGLLLYASTLNFILCTVFLAFELSFLLLKISCRSSSDPLADYLYLGINLLYYCIDLISQGILILRCWILWRRPSIVVVPVILSLAFLATSSLALFSIYRFTHTRVIFTWNHPVLTSGYFISTVVNGLVTTLIASKIILELKARSIYRLEGGSHDLYLSISTLVESGVITLVGQLLQITFWMVGSFNTYTIFSAILPMLYGISSTLILVRVVMGLTYEN